MNRWSIPISEGIHWEKELVEHSDEQLQDTLRKRSCCMSGHRSLPSNLQEQVWLQKNLRGAIAQLVEEGIDIFYTGGALGFDTLAAVTLLEMRQRLPGIQLYLTVPYPEQHLGWSKTDQKLYERIRESADRVYIVSPRYHKDCMKRRNYFMVDHSCVCAHYMTNPTRSGTAQTVKYAYESGCRLINLMQPLKEDIKVEE